MVLAFVLINTEMDYEKSTLKIIGGVEGVKEAYRCYGVYNIIAVVKTETPKELRKTVFRIQKIDKVRSTLTMPDVA